MKSTVGVLFVISFLISTPAQSQTYTSLFSFNIDDYKPDSTGGVSRGGLTQIGSTLYGTTMLGGAGTNGGTFFSIGVDGSNFSVLHNFGVSPGDGVCPDYGSLTVANSTLYGATDYAGGANAGTIYKINPDGMGYTIMHSFTGGSDGSTPNCDLTLIGSTLYGTCRHGGSNSFGTMFKVNADGTGYSTLYSFSGAYNDGPQGGLTLIGSSLYGTTFLGGSHNHGTIFKINPDGSGYTDLYDFTGDADGMQPYGKLATDGSFLYGINTCGGAHSAGTLFRLACDGSAFQVLHDNRGSSYDAQPPTLVGSTLYCAGGGEFNDGDDLFQLNTDGTGYKELHVFGGAYDGPNGGLLLIDSTLYGTTQYGGDNNYGVVYSLAIPEPSTFAMLGVGAAGLLAYARRRRKGPELRVLSRETSESLRQPSSP